MARTFEDAEGTRYGVDDLTYNLQDGKYYVPGSTTAVTEVQNPTSPQEKFVSDKPDFVTGQTVEGEEQDQAPAYTTALPQGRPQSGSSVEPYEAGEGGLPPKPSTSSYATGNNVPPLIQQRMDSAMDNNGVVQGASTPTKLTDKDGAPIADDQEDPKEVKISEPLTMYNAQYPYNQVQETESGHVMELDDTPGAERVNIAHRTGTFIEMHPDGTEVHKITNDSHLYVLGKEVKRVNEDSFTVYDKSVTIKTTAGTVTFQLESGDMNVTLNSGNLNLHLVGGNLNMKVDGDVNEEITGNVTRKIGGSLVEQVTGDVTRETTGNVQHTTSGTTTDNTSGAYTVTGATINLN